MTKKSDGPMHRPTSKYRDFDDYLESEGVKEEIDIAVEKRIISRQISALLLEKSLTKSEFSRMIGTSRAQLDRVMDPGNRNVTLETLKRVANALGKRVSLSFVDS